MSKKIINIQFNKKIIGSKPLFDTDNLKSIREKIKNKKEIYEAKESYLFLDQNGNCIEKEDENDYTLKDIDTGNLIKLVIEESKKKYDVDLDNKRLCSIEYDEKDNLKNLRKILETKIKVEFLFLDSCQNEVEKEDEEDYYVHDILNNEVIKVKSMKTFDSPPANNIMDEPQKEKQKITNTPNPFPDVSNQNHEILENKNGLIVYKYSKLQYQKKKHIYQYFYDKYCDDDYQNALVVLFCGKSGDGKTFAINAIFNIIKGINLEDSYRFKLITEKGKSQCESQTEGVHLYYLKDYNNKPIIIIDSQGFGDTRGIQQDEQLNETFKTIFSEIITHINAVCFVVKSTDEKLDINVKYIFSCVTSLFAQDISENFIIVATHANKEIMKNGPKIINAILKYDVFSKIKEKINNENWYYSLDSYSIFDSEKDNLAEYSFRTLNELYEKKIKQLPRKSIKNCSEVLKYRIELKIEINNLIEKWKELLIEKGKLEKEKKDIEDKDKEISKIVKEIEQLENNNKQKKQIEEKDLEKIIKGIKELDNITKTKKMVQKICEYDETNIIHTHCSICKRNCHSPCDCMFKTFSRCKIYPFWSFEKKCEECGHKKEIHAQDNFHYVFKEIKIAEKSDKEIDSQLYQKEFLEEQFVIDNMFEKKDNRYCKKKYDKINLLKEKKSFLEKKKFDNNKTQKEVEKTIHKLNEDIIKTIYNLKQKSDMLNELAMNNNYFKEVDEYIDSLKDKLIIAGDEIKQLKQLEKVKLNYALFISTVNLNKYEINNLEECQLGKILNNINFQ